MPAAGKVRMDVFNLQGRLVATLVDRTMDAGEHNVLWYAAGQPSGAYMVLISVGGRVLTGRMMLVG